MLFRLAALASFTFAVMVYPATAEERPISDTSYDCLGCHESLHPGLVTGWRASRHAQITPAEAMKVDGLGLKVSNPDVPEDLRDVVVGCAECHNLRPDKHADTYDHNGYRVHNIVSPDDCATCHLLERRQYSRNIMSHAYANLEDNIVFQDLEKTTIGSSMIVKGKMITKDSQNEIDAETCNYCHGTQLAFNGYETRDTDLGELQFPIIEGWPNQGCGRVNLDGSKGACTPCHTRHQFSIEEARKPHTCTECHIGPDVPAAKVYKSSKHGTIYDTHKEKWNYTNVPWVVGEDFRAPTCAACHISLITRPDGEVVVERTHEIMNRLPWRIFGLPYAHPQPKSPDTTIIKSADGLPLPTSLTGEPASEYLIDATEMKKRKDIIQSVCRPCHHSPWIDQHWRRFEKTIEYTNQQTLTATTRILEVWESKYAQGLADGGSVFDEAVEKDWADIWLLHANTVRLSSAIAGGGDYGTFADGRYYVTKRLRELDQWLTTFKRIDELEVQLEKFKGMAVREAEPVKTEQ